MQFFSLNSSCILFLEMQGQVIEIFQMLPCISDLSKMVKIYFDRATQLQDYSLTTQAWIFSCFPWSFMQVKRVPAELSNFLPRAGTAVRHTGSETKLILRLNKQFRKKDWDFDSAWNSSIILQNES